MSLMDIKAKIEAFEKKQKNIAIAYGGDGEILKVIKQTDGKKAIIPFRNYALCDEHANRLENFLNHKSEQKDLAMTRCPFIEWKKVFLDDVDTVSGNKMKMFVPAMSFAGENIKGKGIAEIAIKSADITEALRFNVYVDDKLYLKNVISDGAIVSTVYGATGYFKSIARCIFNGSNIGIAFIAPTQGINNLILDCKSRIRFEFLRNFEIVVSADKTYQRLNVSSDECIEVGEIPDAVSIFGLSEFHCFKCREKRHSVVEDGNVIQDQYAL